MPTGTWTRLPEARRAAVVDAAEREFVRHGFSQGSLNTIAREAGVAKGSLFQYFDDKVDLFTHLADRASARIREHMEAAAADLPWDRDFFGSLHGLNRTWVAYFFDHPVDLALTAAANLEPDPEALPAVRAAANRNYEATLRPLIALAEESGQLRPGADTDALLAALLVILPHIALGPHVEGLDTVLGMYGSPPPAATAAADRLIAVLELAYANRP